jgi:histone H3/H4
MLTPPVKRLFRNGVEHTLIQEQSNEEIDAFIERKILEEQNTSNSKWVHNARKQVKLPYKPVMELADLIAPHEGDKE